jgi:UDP-N-acetylglucosamine--N-acetylmuramyl-(pentapeptide) pyrophosphoryl-undecaprenol N-acetylglucosamine transferase
MSGRILIAASGTGGHLFPALYLAREIQRRDPAVQIWFVGSGRPLEAKIIDAAGFHREVLDVVGVNRRGLRGLVEFLGKLPRALRQAWKILAAFKPDAVVGVGGYVSVLPVFLAWGRGIPTWIHEAELAPGLANRFLAFFATKASVAFKNAKMPRQSRVVFTGHPLRDEILKVPSSLPETTAITNVLVIGGSQGAESLDRALPALGEILKSAQLTVLHQCRAANVEKVSRAYQEQGVSASVAPFIEDMAAAYMWAHLVVSRSGAGTLMELCVVNRPAILVPLPSKGIQQLSNARVLENQGKALVVEEGADFVPRLGQALAYLIKPQNFFAMQAKPCEQRVTDAVERIAAGVLALKKE